jgi:hypothetical protein
MPDRWNELWEMLPSRRQVGRGWAPPLPMILAAWWETPAVIQMKRLEEHIRYADAHGVLADIDRYLRRLREEDWAHLGNFTGAAAESRRGGAND